MPSLPLFVSCQTGTEDDAAAELTALLQPTVPVKTLQGQVLVTIDVAKLGGYDAVATQLRRLVQVDYVHALLASTALYGTDVNGGPLDSIQAAAADVSPDTLAAAVELWRAACRASSDAAAVEAAALPMSKLVFRCLGKRGGRRHDFSSDDAKRVAGRGLKAAAAGLSGSTRDYHFDVLTQVHCNRCWLGLRVNKQPLRAAAATAATAGASGGSPRQGTDESSPADTGPQVVPSGTGCERRAAESAAGAVAFSRGEGTAATAAASATATAAARGDRRAGTGARSPALLASWGRAHLRALGLERPRDARDAAAPLHEMSLTEQRARKQAEMQEVVQRIVRGTGGGGGGGGDGLSRRGRKRLEQAQLGEAGGALGGDRETGGAAVDKHGGEEGGGEEGGGEHGEEQRAEKGGGEGEGEEAGAIAGALCGPIRFAEASRDQRNKCEFHVGRDRQGRPCLGFRLGEGQAADGEAVAPPDGISFVPPWMVAAAAAATAFLREAGGARPAWRSLMLRVQLVKGAAEGGRREAGERKRLRVSEGSGRALPLACWC